MDRKFWQTPDGRIWTLYLQNCSSDGADELLLVSALNAGELRTKMYDSVHIRLEAPRTSFYDPPEAIVGAIQVYVASMRFPGSYNFIKPDALIRLQGVLNLKNAIEIDTPANWVEPPREH